MSTTNAPDLEMTPSVEEILAFIARKRGEPLRSADCGMKNEETSNLLVWVKLDDGEYRAHLPNHPGLTLWLLKCGAEIGPYQLFGAFVPDGMDGVDYPTLGAAQRSAEHFTRYFFKLIQRDFFTKL